MTRRTTTPRRGLALAGATTVLVLVTALAAPAVTAAQRPGGPRATSRVAPPVVDDALNGVFCHDLSLCWSVGYRGTNPSHGFTLAERWSTSENEWQEVTTPSPAAAEESNLQGVSCGSSTCMAVGADESSSLHVSTLAEQWSGSRWSIVPTAHLSGRPSGILWGVSCVDNTDCFAVGSYQKRHNHAETRAVIERWNGTAWALVSSPDPHQSSVLYGVSCKSSTSCLAVGTYVADAIGYALVEHWDGTAWSLVFTRSGISSESVQLDSASCPTSGTCLSAGSYYNTASLQRTLAEEWNTPDRSAFTTPKNPSATHASQLIGISCASASGCVAVGDQPYSASDVHTLAESWNGAAWKVLGTPAISGSHDVVLLAVGCAGTSDCFAVGANFAASHRVITLSEHWNGTTWAVVTTANP